MVCKKCGKTHSISVPKDENICEEIMHLCEYKEDPIKGTKIGSNMYQKVMKSGHMVLFSYNTPVAADHPESGLVRTKTHHSPTTSKHINKWLGGAKAKEVDQSEIDKLVDK